MISTFILLTGLYFEGDLMIRCDSISAAYDVYKDEERYTNLTLNSRTDIIVKETVEEIMRKCEMRSK